MADSDGVGEPASEATAESGEHRPLSAEQVLTRLRSVPAVDYAFRGFGPLVIAGILLLASVLLAPSIAPERIVERPVGGGDTTTDLDLDDLTGEGGDAPSGEETEGEG